MPKRGDSFPHYLIDIDDQSRRPLPPPAPPGLHQPIFFGYAEKGPVNIPTKGSYAYLKEVFGAETFATKSKYFQHPSLFARTALQYQEIWFVRLADDGISTASMVLEAVAKETAVIQYQKDATGARVLDGSGDPIPLLEIDGITPTTEPGIELTWAIRPIDYTGGETLKTLAVVATVDGTDPVNTYPIIAFEADNVGSSGNLMGFKFYYDPEFETSVVENTGAMTYKFAPMVLDESTNIALPVRDIYQDPSIEVTLMRDALDTSVAMYYDLEERIRNQYTSTDGNAPHSLLNTTIHVYDTNVATLSDAILALSPELVDVTTYMLNIVSGVDQSGNEYDHLAVTNPTAVLYPSRINYMAGGSDGSLTAANLELLTQAYLTGVVYPQIGDEARYSFTHLYDSGYTMATKTALIDFMGIRADVKIDIATQDVSLEPNTKSEDQSAGSALRAAALLHPESSYFGTSAIRCSIYQQCGKLSSDPTWLKWVPANIDRLMKRCMYDSTQKVKGQPTGLPNSAVEIFSEVNWTPSSDDQKRLNWGTALNYMQHYDTNAMHYADLRSVYPYDNSVLSDDIAVDYLVYLKHITRIVWATYVGLRVKPETLFETISKDVDKRCYNAFGGHMTSETTVFQTDEDSALGYRSTVEISVKLPMVNRVLNVQIPVDRLV